MEDLHGRLQRNRMREILAEESRLLDRGGVLVGGYMDGGYGTSAGAKKGWKTRRAGIKTVKKVGSKTSKKPSTWNATVKHVRECNPDVTFKQAVKHASQIYKKKTGSGLMYAMGGNFDEDLNDMYGGYGTSVGAKKGWATRRKKAGSKTSKKKVTKRKTTKRKTSIPTFRSGPRCDPYLIKKKT